MRFFLTADLKVRPWKQLILVFLVLLLSYQAGKAGLLFAQDLASPVSWLLNYGEQGIGYAAILEEIHLQFFFWFWTWLLLLSLSVRLFSSSGGPRLALLRAGAWGVLLTIFLSEAGKLLIASMAVFAYICWALSWLLQTLALAITLALILKLALHKEREIY
jgi:hypothetical protein